MAAHYANKQLGFTQNSTSTKICSPRPATRSSSKRKVALLLLCTCSSMITTWHVKASQHTKGSDPLSLRMRPFPYCWATPSLHAVHVSCIPRISCSHEWDDTFLPPPSLLKWGLPSTLLQSRAPLSPLSSLFNAHFACQYATHLASCTLLGCGHPPVDTLQRVPSLPFELYIHAACSLLIRDPPPGLYKLPALSYLPTAATSL